MCVCVCVYACVCVCSTLTKLRTVLTTLDSKKNVFVRKKVCVCACVRVCVHVCVWSTLTKRSTVLTTLDPKKKVAVKLISKEDLSRDSRRLRFALPSPKHVLGLPIGNHFFVNATIDGAACMRAYTPTSLDDDVGFQKQCPG